MGKIAVIGDVMLDKYDYCENRSNPESSAPCYRVIRTEYKPGGAGNVAANLSSLCSEVLLIGLIGDDEAGEKLKHSLNSFRIPHNLITNTQRPTIVKERVFSIDDRRYHYRKDFEVRMPIEPNHVSEIIALAKEFPIILISDYNKGIILEQLMNSLKKLNAEIIVDPKSVHKNFYKGVFLIKPNLKEAREMSGLDDALLAAKKLSRDLETRILLTRGKEGIIYRDDSKNQTINLRGENVELVDVTGAGDSVIAAFTHFHSNGYSIDDCVRLANKAGAIAVTHPGCYHAREADLLNE